MGIYPFNVCLHLDANDSCTFMNDVLNVVSTSAGQIILMLNKKELLKLPYIIYIEQKDKGLLSFV